MSDYSSIPTAGEHRGPKEENTTGTEVRAPEPQDVNAGENTKAQGETSGGSPTDETTYRLVHSPDQGQYRLSRWQEGAALDEGYRELGRYRAGELGSALSKLPDAPRFVVFENSETGEVQMQRESDISANWTDGGRFDRVILFDDESEAAAYAASRQG